MDLSAHQLDEAAVLALVLGRLELALEALQAHGDGVERVPHLMRYRGRQIAHHRKVLPALHLRFQGLDLLHVEPLVVQDRREPEHTQGQDAAAETHHGPEALPPGGVHRVHGQADPEVAHGVVVQRDGLDQLVASSAGVGLRDTMSRALGRARPCRQVVQHRDPDECGVGMREHGEVVVQQRELVDIILPPQVLDLALDADLPLELEHVGRVRVHGDVSGEAPGLQGDAEDAVLPELVLGKRGCLARKLGPEPPPDMDRRIVTGPAAPKRGQEIVEVGRFGSGVRNPRAPLTVQELHLVEVVDGADVLYQPFGGVGGQQPVDDPRVVQQALAHELLDQLIALDGLLGARFHGLGQGQRLDLHLAHELFLQPAALVEDIKREQDHQQQDRGEEVGDEGSAFHGCSWPVSNGSWRQTATGGFNYTNGLELGKNALPAHAREKGRGDGTARRPIAPEEGARSGTDSLA